MKALCYTVYATSKQSGMTGTGAPVTEQLRCPLGSSSLSIGDKLGWYRDETRPYAKGRVFLFYGGL